MTCGVKLQGGRRTRSKSRKSRKTRKMSKGASTWNQKMMTVYREMKRKNPNVRLGEAMKEASRRNKRGEL
jgi:hypothetical protein